MAFERPSSELLKTKKSASSTNEPRSSSRRRKKEEAKAAVAEAEDEQVNFAVFGGMGEEGESDAGDLGGGFVPGDEALPENGQANFAALFIPGAALINPPSEGAQGTADHHDCLIARKPVLRQRERSLSSKIAKTKAKNRLLSEGPATLLWAPLPIGTSPLLNWDSLW